MNPSVPQDIPRLTEHLFRQESGKLVSMLTGIFGIQKLQLAEDVVQEALIRALQTWPYYGIPQNPTAWLMQTAKRMAIDVVRREKLFQHKQPEIITAMEQWPTDGETKDSVMFDDEIKDGRLRLIFACCHPLIPLEAQSALALRTLCGFSPEEIATAFLITVVAVNKRLTRARQKIRDQDIPFEIPTGAELSARLDGVLLVLYLLFNEGYKASSGDTLIKEQLCHEAIQLAMALADHPATNGPRTQALLALMWFNTARLSSRVDAEGQLLRLHEQDRSTWDKTMIHRGLEHLTKAASGTDLSEYHLQAGIAACHCAAKTEADTNWSAILSCYDRWMLLNASPLIALNRAVAVAKVHGPAEGLKAVRAIPDLASLEGYYLVHAVLGELEAERGKPADALSHLRKALKLATMKPEQDFLTKRLKACEAASSRT